MVAMAIVDPTSCPSGAMEAEKPRDFQLNDGCWFDDCFLLDQGAIVYLKDAFTCNNCKVTLYAGCNSLMQIH